MESKTKTICRFTTTVSDTILYIAYENKAYDLPALEILLHKSLQIETKNINRKKR